MTILNFILGIIGVITGCIGTWLSIQSRRQHLKINMSDDWTQPCKITNHSLRPIPIQKIILLINEGSGFNPSKEYPILDDIEIPGVLPPESSFKVSWKNISQIVELITPKERQIEIHTQTGKIIRSRKSKRPQNTNVN